MSPKVVEWESLQAQRLLRTMWFAHTLTRLAPHQEVGDLRLPQPRTTITPDFPSFSVIVRFVTGVVLNATGVLKRFCER
jgi:hypothetical protein